MLHQGFSLSGPSVCKGGRCKQMVPSPGEPMSQNSDLSLCQMGPWAVLRMPISEPLREELGGLLASEPRVLPGASQASALPHRSAPSQNLYGKPL